MAAHKLQAVLVACCETKRKKIPLVNHGLNHCQLILLRYPFPFLAATTKSVTLKILNEPAVTVNGLVFGATLYDVMQKAANEGKLT